MKSFIKLAFKSVTTFLILLLLGYFVWQYITPKLSEKDGRENRDVSSKQEKNSPRKEKKSESKTETAFVSRVFDGDTFEAKIDGRKEKVRMLGIDTPEKHSSDKLGRDAERTGKDKKTIQKLGELSAKYTIKLIEGKKVLLKTEPGGDDKDRYGRLLRYVYLEDGTFVNLKIVKEGYANAYRRYRLSKMQEFIDAENSARENKKGLWGRIEGLEYFENSDK